MEGIYDPNNKFPFDKVMLSSPMAVSGGNYFLKLLVDKAPLYLQMPKSKSKSGIVQSGKKNYCELMFTNDNEELITWMEDLENYACKYIYENREKWFETEMELNDIENYFSSPMKTFKSGKFYLTRVNIPQRLGKIHLKIFDENQEHVESTNINEKTDMITIIEIQGIKCSARSFQFEMELKQMMTLETNDLFEQCLLGNKKPTIQNTVPLETAIQETVEKDEPELILETMEKEEDKIEETDPSTGTLEDFLEDSLKNEIVEEKENNSETLEKPAILTDVMEEEKKFLESENDGEESLENVEEIEQTSMKEEDLKDLEINFDISELSDQDTVQLKARNDVYYELYKEARKKAKIAKKMALDAYLEASKIKKTYQLDSESESDEEWMDTMRNDTA